MTKIAFKTVYEELTGGEPRPETVRAVFDAILSGEWTPVQVAGFVAGLGVRGATAETIAAAAGSMRRAMVRVDHGLPRVLDTCGTGGDGKGSLNISTGAAIVAAASGAPVAKHGNRAVSSKAGAADVLEALGIPVDLPPECARSLLRDVGIAFLLAPTHHPAMRHAAVARRELGVRTIFNCLGPLASPAQATHQLVGAFADSLRSVMAETLRTLGTERAWVVRGDDGLDEVSITGITRVTQLADGKLEDRTVHPEDFGLEPSPPDAVAGGSAEDNANALEAILGGEAHPGRDAVLINAAAALVVFDALDPKDAARRAREAIDSGSAKQKLDAWRQAARAARS